MTLKQMEYLLQVADLGGFSRAALSLDVAQSSLSRQIRLLEVELRKNLFYRNGRGVMLTEHGKRFVEHSRAILESVARARSDLAEPAQNPIGNIVIGLPPRVARYLTAPLVQSYRKQFPKATISIVEGMSTSLVEWLTLGRLDLALLYNPLTSSKIELEPLLTEEQVLIGCAITKPSLPKAMKFSQISKYSLILPQMPNASRMLIDLICKQTRTALKVSVEVDTVQSIMELVLLNQGYGILPMSMTTAQVSKRKLQISRIHTPAIHSTLVLARSKQRPITKLAEETSHLIRALDLPKLIHRSQF